LIAVAAVPPDGLHTYVYGPGAPAGTTVAEPVLAPLHKTFVCDVVAVSVFVVVIVKFLVRVQPLESVIVTE
jgi:hypothetical protein